MPVRDDDFTRALRDAAPAVDPADAYEQVRAKRARRATARRARIGVLAALVIVLGVGGIALVARNDGPAHVSTPAASAPTTTTTRPPVGWFPVKLATDEGYLRGPLTLSERDGRTLVSAAAYDRDADGSFSFPPSRIVRFDPTTLKVADRVDLKAEILSVVDADDGVRFALTRNPDPEGPTLPGLFLKRIAADGTVQSTPLPPGTTTTGGIMWHGGSGAVYLTAQYFQEFDADGRLSGPVGATIWPAPELPTGFVLRPAADVIASRSVAPDEARAAASSVASTGQLWYQGTLDGVPAVALVRDGVSPQVVTFPGGTDTSFAWVDDHNVLATSGGKLYRHPVG